MGVMERTKLYNPLLQGGITKKLKVRVPILVQNTSIRPCLRTKQISSNYVKMYLSNEEHKRGRHEF